MPEILTDDKSKRTTYLPVRCTDIHDLYFTSEKMFWRSSEIMWQRKDTEDLHAMSQEKKTALKHVLGLFWVLDVVVASNTAEILLPKIHLNEARKLLQYQITMENIHDNSYNECIQYLYPKEEEQEEIKRNIIDGSSIVELKNWIASKYNNEDDLDTLLLLGICVEGLVFSPLFAFIGWITFEGVMDRLKELNHIVRRDEGTHCDTYTVFHKYVEKKLPEKKAQALFKEAVDIVTKFVSTFLPKDSTGMNIDMMTNYIQCNADFYLNNLGYNILYEAKNPFEFMTFTATDEKSNVHERIPLEYSKVSHSIGVEVDMGWADESIEGIFN